MIRVGDIYQKVGKGRWGDEENDLVVIVWSTPLQIRYRYIDRASHDHQLSSSWDLKSFDRWFRGVKCD